MALVPQVVDSVRIPVVAAGGISDGRGLVSALALGAQGIQMGTRFIATKECQAHDDYKQAICRAQEEDIVLTERISGIPVSVIKTPSSIWIPIPSSWINRHGSITSKTPGSNG